MLTALRAPEVKSALARHDSVDIGSTPAELAASIRSTMELTASLARMIGIKPE